MERVCNIIIEIFMSRKSWILTKRSVIKGKVRKSVPFKWVFKSQEEAERLFFLKSRNVVNGYMEVPGVDFTDSLSPVASDTSTRIAVERRDRKSVVFNSDVSRC